MEVNIQKVITISLLFKDFHKHRLLFGMEKLKTNVFNNWNKKQFLKSINVIFHSFGLKITYKNNRLRKKGKRIYNILYTLEFENNIDNFINFDDLLKKYNVNR